MLDKYIKINESTILVGQNNSGVWYCKELPAKDIDELRTLMGEVSRLLNEHNGHVDVPEKEKVKDLKK